MISVNCECGKNYEVPDDWAGKAAKCNKCGAAINVPFARGSAVKEQSRPVEDVGAGYVMQRRNDFGSGCFLQILAAGLFLVGLIGIATIIAPLILWPLAGYLFSAGGSSGIWCECSQCREKVNRHAAVCRSCGIRFTPTQPTSSPLQKYFFVFGVCLVLVILLASVVDLLM